MKISPRNRTNSYDEDEHVVENPYDDFLGEFLWRRKHSSDLRGRILGSVKEILFTYEVLIPLSDLCRENPEKGEQSNIQSRPQCAVARTPPLSPLPVRKQVIQRTEIRFIRPAKWVQKCESVPVTRGKARDINPANRTKKTGSLVVNQCKEPSPRKRSNTGIVAPRHSPPCQMRKRQSVGERCGPRTNEERMFQGLIPLDYATGGPKKPRRSRHLNPQWNWPMGVFQCSRRECMPDDVIIWVPIPLSKALESASEAPVPMGVAALLVTMSAC
ncbi:hypothetical protein RF11_14776 [Thelohanellus kitauei]|uniref:Uncharacterized protein n=1 Tax=Thelohanellus kitauei TaxID=669202 RepID=A0A0C2MQJ7_THEKT|nr:hypothetical protein RF11_14776 [Thelohanellus kitauei]